jgi:GLPGLI family protein
VLPLITKLSRFFLTLFFLVNGIILFAQPLSTDSSREENDLAISYELIINSGIKKNSIAETYNGGSRTIFISDAKARIRLVSLMRIESTYFEDLTDSTGTVYQVKESGRKPLQKKLTAAEWKQFNAKYDSIRCEPIDGISKKILGYSCKKALLHLQDGRQITVFYTEELPAIHSLYEPAFACVPGLVLQYEYGYQKGKATFTAVSLKKESINPEIFAVKKLNLSNIKL